MAGPGQKSLRGPVVPRAESKRDEEKPTVELKGLFEPAPKLLASFGGQRSIQLSYGRLVRPQ